MSKKNDDRKNVVVVGGGGGGALTAQLFSKSLDDSKYNLILVDSRPHWIFAPATLRMLVSDVNKLEECILFPLTQVFVNNKGTFIQARVTAIEKQGTRGGHLYLSNCKRLPFDVLVLSPGAKWDGLLAFPDEKEELEAYISEKRAAFKAANDIGLVGGGSVGIEVAGEIKDVWPDKNVTIVQGDNSVMNKTYPDKFRRALEQCLRARGVNLVFNDYIDEFPKEGVTEVMSRDGKSLKADLVLSTRGPKPNTVFITSFLGQETVSDNKYIKVKPTFQLEGHEEIFAIGDAVDLPEQKQLIKSMAHAPIAAENVQQLLREQAPTKEYKGGTELIVVTVGRDGGAGYVDMLWGIVLGNCLTRWLKSRGLLIDHVKGSFGFT